MFQTYQWQCNADSSHNSEHYRLQLLVAVGFLLDDLSGIWRAGRNIVAAIKSYLGWRSLRWALLWSVPCEKLWFGFLRPLHFQSDSSLEVWGSRHRATWGCRMRDSGREVSVQLVFHKSSSSVQNHINLPVPSHWLLGHCKVSLSTSCPWKHCSLPVPGLHFHMFSCSSEKLWFLQPFNHPQILQDILIR